MPAPPLTDEVSTSTRDQERLIEEVEECLRQSAVLRARQLLEAHRFTSESERLQRLRLAFALPHARAVQGDVRNTMGDNVPWLESHGQEYQGQWVALEGGALLAHAPRYRELHQELKSRKLIDRVLVVKL